LDPKPHPLMKQTSTLTLLQHEQPGTKVWRELVQVVTRWNEVESPQFTRVAEFMWHVNFDSASEAQMNRLVSQLEALKQRQGAVYHLASRSLIEESDYAVADFIEILGVGLGSTSRPFLVNEATAFGTPVPCPTCGAQDAFSAPQRAAFVIDETLLDEANSSGAKAPPGGWDLINLANGQKLISQRFARVLDHNDIEGYDLIEVIDSATRQPSKRMVQIAATRAVLAPCPEHSVVEGRSFCPTCGTAQGTLKGFFWVRRDWIDGDEIVARHPNRGAMLYVSHRIYDALLAAKLNGIHRNDVLRVCEHVAEDR
jgi:hypothetical protein